MSLILQGSTSGSITLQEPAVAGTTVLDLPAVSGTILTTTSPKAGNVIQVVSTTKTDTFSTTSTSFTDITGLSVTITPSSSANKILIIVNFAMSSSSTGGLNTFNLVRGATNISQPATTPSFAGTMCAYIDQADSVVPVSISFLDSPAVTSSTTYKVQMKVNTGTQYINRRSSADSAFTSTITVMEIAG